MTKLKFVLPILLLGTLVLVGGGCGKKAAEEGTPAGEEAGEVSLDEVLGKAKNLGSYKFDVMITQANQPTMESKMWVEGANMRWEGTAEGQDMVYILNATEQSAYIYLLSQNMAMKQNFVKAKGEIGNSPTEESGGILEQSPEVLGTEVWDGKTCLVVKSTSNQGDVTKWWVWTKYGIPIKIEITLNTGEVIVNALKNMVVGDIPDSMFELPSGVQIMEMPSGF